MVALGRALMPGPGSSCSTSRPWAWPPGWRPAIFTVFSGHQPGRGTPSSWSSRTSRAALALAHRGYVLEHGRLAAEGPAASLLADPGLRRAYLGPLAAPAPPVIALQQLVLGLLLGGLYGLAAAGLSLVFGVLKVLNVAHGELIMLGGYAAFWLATAHAMDPFAALLIVIPATAALGFVLYQALFTLWSASTRRPGSGIRSWSASACP